MFITDITLDITPLAELLLAPTLTVSYDVTVHTPLTHLNHPVVRKAMEMSFPRNSIYQPGSIVSEASVKSPVHEFYSQVKLVSVLGEGGFGCVYKAQFLGPLPPDYQQPFVAIKMLIDTVEESRRHMEQEIAVLEGLPAHRGLVRILHLWHSPKAVIMEFCPHGSLRDYLGRIRAALKRKERSDSGFEEGSDETTTDAEKSSLRADYEEQQLMSTDYSVLFMNFAAQIADAMDFLSTLSIVHRDLAARNVLVFENNVVKVTDFGLSRPVRERGEYLQTHNAQLPVKWMAPEALTLHCYTQKTDVWSYGVLLWEMGSVGGCPYACLDGPSVLQLVAQTQRPLYRLPRPHSASPQLYLVMLECWEQEPEARPPFAQLRSRLDALLTAKAGYISVLDCPIAD